MQECYNRVAGHSKAKRQPNSQIVSADNYSAVGAAPCCIPPPRGPPSLPGLTIAVSDVARNEATPVLARHRNFLSLAGRTGSLFVTGQEICSHWTDGFTMFGKPHSANPCDCTVLLSHARVETKYLVAIAQRIHPPSQTYRPSKLS